MNALLPSLSDGRIPDIFLVIYLISLTTGFMAISISLLLAIKHRRRLQVLFTLILVSMFLELFYYLLLYLYSRMGALHDPLALGLARSVYMIGLSLFITGFPVFVLNAFIGKSRTRDHLPFISLSLAVLLFFVLQAIFQFPYQIVYAVNYASFLAAMGVGLALPVFNMRKIHDRNLRKIIITSEIVLLAMAPFVVVDILLESATISLPLDYFLLNTMSIFFAFLYSDTPPFLEQRWATEFLTDKYGITKREMEILSLMMMGFSNIEIGKKVFVSLHTVENHIHNIYQKLDVKNRVGVIKLLDSFSQQKSAEDTRLRMFKGSAEHSQASFE
jgi:DNA-binding CsgD family transcriptional regulator